MPSGGVVLPTLVHSSQQRQRKKTPNKLKRFQKVFSSPKFLVYPLFQIAYNPLRISFLFSIEHIAYILRFVPKSIYPELFYPIEEEIVSSTTRVIFTRRKQNRQPVCLKLWQFENICNPKLVIRDINYLLEGFEFNRRFAPSVYLGIAPVDIEERPSQEKEIRRGKLIEEPQEQDFKSGVQYAIVMRRLDESQRLDHQLYFQKLSEQVDLAFLAKEVARMHKKLDNSSIDKGTPASILTKLELNIQLFEECLQHLNESRDFIARYLWISELIATASARYGDLFQKRHDDHHIKRCHGDLKTTNLWIEPEKSYLFGLIKRPRQLFAIDCVDFNPEFCHIDTLSDLAMLVIDLEMHFWTDWLKAKSFSNVQEQEGESLTVYFLDCYLKEMQEDRDKWDPLLEYYMTEKSMVCAYVSILYDERPLIGKKYLEVAYIHAQRLEKMLKQSTSKEQTYPLLVSSHFS
jgi:aminoglycoside phosphotransferase family enzyme